MSLITLNSAVTAAFDKEISSSGLVMEFRSYAAVNQSILSASSDLAYHISKSNITDVFFCFEHEISMLTEAANPLNIPHYKGLAAVNDDLDGHYERRLNSKATTVARQRLKAVNFMPFSEYMTNHGYGTDAMRNARDTTKPNWRLLFGSKPIPETSALELLKAFLI